MPKLIKVRIEIFQEDNCYVGICPALDVSSFGDSITAAKASLQEALNAFFEECIVMGTLTEVLKEAGFEEQDDKWISREPISTELVVIG